MATAENKPSGMETKTYITGASGDEVNIGYSPAAVPNKDGMADGLTPGTTNTPGPYEAPAQGDEAASGDGETAEKSGPSKTTGGKGGTKTTGS